MNDSSGFRGVPSMIGGGAAAAAGHHDGRASGGGWMNQPGVNDLALRAAHPSGAHFFPRLDSLPSSLYSAGDLSVASRLFPNAHLLQVAAVAAAANAAAANSSAAQPTLPSSLSHMHQAAAHHSLLPLIYPHLPGGYGGSGAAAAVAATRAAATSRHHQQYLPMEAHGAGMPRYRYLLPSAPNMAANAAQTYANAEMEFAALAAAGKCRPTPASPRITPQTSAVLDSLASRAASRPVPSTPTNNGVATVGVTSTQQTVVVPTVTNSNNNNNNNNNNNSNSNASNNNGQVSAGRTVVADTKKPQAKVKTSGLPTQPYYPSHFMKGTVIQLANGELKRVEELSTEDFIRSAYLTDELKIDTSQVIKMEQRTSETVLLCFSVGDHKVQVSVEATIEHPFFVIGQGWSSCSPQRTQNLYGLPCQSLQVGDVCISLTHRDALVRVATTSAQQATFSLSSWQPKRSPTSSVNSSNGNLGVGGAGAEFCPPKAIKRNANSARPDEEQRRKRRQTVMLDDLPLSDTVCGHRSSATPPTVSTVERKPPKIRRWSVS